MAIDARRRNLAATLLGAVGASALLKGCTAPSQSDMAREAPYDPEDDSVGDTVLAAVSTANIRRIGTVAELRSATGAAEYVAIVSGYQTVADGGGGVFVWSTVAALDNGGTVINSVAGANTAGWRRVYSGALNVRWFGAKCNGSDDTIAVQAALDALPNGGTLLIPGMTGIGGAGIAIQGTPGVPRKRVQVVGVGQNSGFIALAQSNSALPSSATYLFLLRLIDCEAITVRNLRFELSSQAYVMGFLGMERCTHCRVENSTFTEMPGDANSTIQYAVRTVAGAYNSFEANRFLKCHWALCLGEGNHQFGVALSEAWTMVSRNYFLDTKASPIAGTIEHGEVVDNYLINATRSGIVVGGGTAVTNHLTIARNHLQDCPIQFDAIASSPISDVIIADNFIEISTKAVAAIALHKGLRVTVRGNVVRMIGQSVPANSQHFGGINMNSTIDGQLIDNVLSYERPYKQGDATCGITISDNAGVCNRITLRGNQISGYVGSSDSPYAGSGIGIFVQSPVYNGSYRSLVIQGNAVSDNTTYGILLFNSHHANPLPVSALVVDNIVHGHLRDICIDSHGYEVIGANNVFNTIGYHDSGPAGNNPPQTIPTRQSQHTVVHVASPPTTGTWRPGDIAHNIAPSAGAPAGWMFGTDLVWHAFGTLA